MTRHTYDLKLEPKGFEGSIPGHFAVIVHNKGQFELPIKLFASDERERASYQLMPSVLSVPAGAKVSSHLLVVPTDMTAFLQAIEFMVQDSFGKAVKGEYSPEFEEEEEQESGSSQQEAEGHADGGREGGSNAPTRLNVPIRPRQPRQSVSFGGRGSRMSLPVDTTIRVLMGMAAFLLIFLVVTIGLWLSPNPSLVLSQAPAITQTIEATVIKVSPSIPSPTATPPPIPTATPPIPTATPPIPTATPPIPTVTLRTGGSERATPTEIPIEAITPTDIPIQRSPTPIFASSTPTDIPIQRSRTPIEALPPTNIPIFASSTPTGIPIRAITPTETPVRVPITPATSIPIERSQTPTPIVVPATETATLTAVPATETATLTAVPATETATLTAVPATETATLTAVPPTETATLTAVPATETATLTAVPPTETATLTAVPATETATLTAVPATETATLTAVPATETATLTAVPATDTPTATTEPPTNTPTATTEPPTNTPTVTAEPPTNTPTVTPSLTPQLSFPDLIIRSLEVTGSPVQNNDGSFQVPIMVMIYNQGEATSDIFKVAIEASQSQGTFVVPFTVAGQSSIWYPFTSAPLAAGSRVLLEGTVTLDSSPSGEFVTLTAIADSCSGDEFMPDYCRIEESDEQNNRSAPATVRLPATSRTESIEKGE